MKKLILKGFEVQLVMVFFAFMIFATNEFTLSHLWINIIASILVLFVYLLMFYSDSYKTTREYIKLGKKPPVPVVANAVVYIIPAVLLIWSIAFPIYFDKAYIIEPGDLSNGVPPVYDYVKAVRQTAWFELYMFPYKGIYEMFGSSTLCHLITFLPAPIASALGYVTAKHDFDLMKRASYLIQKLVYRNKEN